MINFFKKILNKKTLICFIELFNNVLCSIISQVKILFSNHEDGIVDVFGSSGKAEITTRLINVFAVNSPCTISVDSALSIRYPLTILRADVSNNTIQIVGINGTTINGEESISIFGGKFSSITIAKRSEKDMVIISKTE